MAGVSAKNGQESKRTNARTQALPSLTSDSLRGMSAKSASCDLRYHAGCEICPKWEYKRWPAFERCIGAGASRLPYGWPVQHVGSDFSVRVNGDCTAIPSLPPVSSHVLITHHCAPSTRLRSSPCHIPCQTSWKYKQTRNAMGRGPRPTRCPALCLLRRPYRLVLATGGVGCGPPPLFCHRCAWGFPAPSSATRSHAPVRHPAGLTHRSSRCRVFVPPRLFQISLHICSGRPCGRACRRVPYRTHNVVCCLRGRAVAAGAWKTP